MCTAELTSWLHQPNPQRFPFEAVVRTYHSVGKHFVPADVLTLLGEARAVLPGLHGPWPRLRELAAFLDTTLDKSDDSYTYPTYLALALLELPSTDDRLAQAPFARSRCDRLTAQLVADALSFELAALDGQTTLLPNMRPGSGLVEKRIRHGLRSIRPALARMALHGGLTATDHTDQARQACALVYADMSVAERRTLQLTVLPVHTVHDEYLFLRVLQAFETTFALLAVHLRAAVTALTAGEVDRALYFLTSSAAALRETAPLFSMLATMQVDSFRTFRQFTEGASAIQSQNYKIVESLCRRPTPERVDSPAYHSVPDIHDRVTAQQHPTLDDAYTHACRSGDRTEEELTRLAAAMSDFAAALIRWRTAHYRLALRMLGDATGTGYTEGTPYLAAVREIPVFTTVDTDNRVNSDDLRT